MASSENPLPPHDEPPLTLPPQPSVPDGAWSPAPAPSSRAEDPPWSAWDVVRIAVLAVVTIGLFTIFAMALLAARTRAPVSPADLARDPHLVVPAQLAAYLVVIVYMVLLVHSRGRAFWTSIKWNFPVARWVGYVALGIALAVLVQTASTLLPIPKSLPIDRYFRDRLGAWMMALFGISFAPLLEELFFRGFLYPVIARRWGVPAGVLGTAALFAFIHESQLAHAWAPMLLLFGVGVVLTWVRARTGSVAATFLIHVGYNSTLFFLLYLASDHFRHLEKVS